MGFFILPAPGAQLRPLQNWFGMTWKKGRWRREEEKKQTSGTVTKRESVEMFSA